MQVYVLFEAHEYEGSQALGVFASEAELRAAFASYEVDRAPFAYYFFRVMEVGQVAEERQVVYLDKEVA